MGKIIAMGGGEMREGETFPLDRQVVSLTGKTYPQALLIPTASGDAEDYYTIFKQRYGDQLGCTTDVLYLLRETPPYEQTKSRIEAASGSR
jgi:dipeptidase E